VHLVHLANEFSALIAVSDTHYYCAIYWIYVSSTFFLVFLFSDSVSICLISASPWQFGLSACLCLEKMPWLRHCWLLADKFRRFDEVDRQRERRRERQTESTYYVDSVCLSLSLYLYIICQGEAEAREMETARYGA